jgi:hypothetical protein
MKADKDEKKQDGPTPKDGAAPKPKPKGKAKVGWAGLNPGPDDLSEFFF